MWSLPVASRNPSTRRDLPTPASPWISTTWPRPWQLPSQARNSSPISSWRPTRGAELPVRVAANRLSTSRADKTRHAGTGSANPLSSIGPEILEVEVIAEHRARRRADDDLVRLRQCLQTRRQVRRLADDRGFRCGSFADLDRRRSPVRWRCRSAPRARPRAASGPRHSAPPSHRRCRDPPAPNARPRPHGRAGSRNRRGCRRPCTSRQSRRNAGSRHCTGSDTTRSHRADLRGPSRWRAPSIRPGRKTSRSAAGARPPVLRRSQRCGRNRRQGERRGDRRKCRRRGVAGLERAAPTKASPCPPSSTARRLTISS